MKIFGIIILALLSASAFPQAWHRRDSLGVFYTPQKVSILIGEIFNPKRLHKLWDAAGLDGEGLELSSLDGSLRIHCFRIPEAADCKFIFIPSAYVNIVPRQVKARFPLDQLSLPLSNEFAMHFRSANGDVCDIKIEAGEFIIEAKKK